MSTKVKGKAIKEGSIPLSALEDNIKSSITYVGVLTPQNPIIKLRQGVTHLINDYYVIKPGETITLYGSLNIEYSIRGGLKLIAHYGDGPYKGNLTVKQNRYIQDFELPDTVLKTTPQELSDTNKNQALANLGIDPVVWKYMTSPLTIRDGGNVPDELIDETGVFKYSNKNMFHYIGGIVLNVDGAAIQVYQLFDDEEAGITPGIYNYNLENGKLYFS